MSITADMLVVIYLVYSVLVGLSQGVIIVAAPMLALFLSYIIMAGSTAQFPVQLTEFVFKLMGNIGGAKMPVGIENNSWVAVAENVTGKDISYIISYLFTFSLIAIFLRTFIFSVSVKAGHTGVVAAPSRIIGAITNLVLSLCVLWVGMTCLDFLSMAGGTSLESYEELVSTGLIHVIHANNPFNNLVF